MRPLFEGRHLPVAHLVEDPAGILVAKVVDPASLPGSERTEGRRRQLRRERQGLQAREDAVAAEHGHEPREAGRGQAPSARDGWCEAKRGEIDQAAPVRDLERIGVAFESRRLGQPALQASPHVRPSLSLTAHVLRPDVRSPGPGRDHDIEIGRPLALGLDPNRKSQTLLVDLRGRGRGDRGLARERPPLVTEQQPPVLDPRVVAPFLLKRILDLEQVGEIAGCVDPDLEVDRLRVVIQDRQFLVEAVADGAPPDHGQLGIDVDRPRARNEEEARLEVLQVVDRERIEPLAVHCQDPRREEAVVEREETGRVGERCLDVAARVADDEGVAVENLDEVVVHGVLLGGAGKRR